MPAAHATASAALPARYTNGMMIRLVIAAAVALVAWRGIALFNYTFHKKRL